MTVAHRLATFACETTALAPTTRAAAVRTVFDLVAAAIAGRKTAGGISALKAAPAAWGPGPATCWFSDQRLSVPGAAFVNAAFASMLDLDDGHRGASGHPGAAVIPAVIATAEAHGADAERLLTAIAIGYEIGVRIAGARDVDTLHTFDSGLWCGQAAAAAAGWLRGLDADRLANAIAIAGTTAPGQTATAYTKLMGNNVKEGIPFATALGLVAVELAVAGFTGPIDFLDEARRYDRTILTADLGSRWLIETTYFKPYGCCRWAHAAIDALFDIMGKDQVTADEISTVRVETFAQTLWLNNDLAPPTLEAAQYSVPFCIAAAAVHGADALVPLEDALLTDPEILAFAPRVTVAVAPDLDSMFPRSVPARIAVTTQRGIMTRTVLAPRGEPVNPLSDDDLRAKFSTIARTRLTPAISTSLLDAIAALDAGELAPLLTSLASAPALAPSAVNV
jgi:2-methylcitrate dehydratase PrpD